MTASSARRSFSSTASSRRVRIATRKAVIVIQGTPTHRIKVVDPKTGELVWKRMAEVGAGDIVALSMGSFVGSPAPVRLPAIGEAYWTGDLRRPSFLAQ